LTSAASAIAFMATFPWRERAAGGDRPDQRLHLMREFTDANGRAWIASARKEGGPDYKGRLFMVLEPVSDGEGGPLELREVRWNSERTARRTLDTMSLVELRRRLRAAQGRRNEGPTA
jgi:hypothetical protein